MCWSTERATNPPQGKLKAVGCKAYTSVKSPPHAAVLL